MIIGRILAPASFGCAYFLIASISLLLTRLDGGVAFVWAGSAMLLAKLALLEKPQRKVYICASALASTLATGLFGLGWAASPMLAAINIIEPLLGCMILLRFGRHHQVGSVSWLGWFVLASALPSAISGLAIAVYSRLVIGSAPVPVLLNWLIGHSMGFLIFTPLFAELFRGRLRERLRACPRATPASTIVLTGSMAALVLGTFAQSRLPILFIPILPLVFLTYRLGELGVAAGMAILIVIATAATALGMGPAMLINPALFSHLHFLQVYFAAAMLTVLPLAGALARRDALHGELAQSEARYRMLSDHSADVIASLDLLGNFRFVSPSIELNSGHPPHAMIGKSPLLIIDPAFHDAVRKAHYDTLKGAGAMVRVEYLVQTCAGALRWFETHERAVLDELGNPTGIVAFIRDIHERKAAEERLAREARTDVLTGAANRRTIMETLEGAIASRTCGTVILFDLDHFKAINDRHGHAAGDLTLRIFAQTTFDVIRANDLLARIGGEEFVLFLPDASPQQAAVIGNRVREAFAGQHIACETGQIRATVSAGVASLGPSCAQTLQRADAALYSAKHAGRDQLAIAS